MSVKIQHVKDFMQIVSPSAYQDDERFLNHFLDDTAIQESPTGKIFVGHDHLSDLMINHWIISLPDMKMKRNDINIYGNNVVSKWELEAHHLSELWGISATGKKLSIYGEFHLSYSNEGLINKYRSIMDISKLITDMNPSLSANDVINTPNNEHTYGNTINIILNSRLTKIEINVISLYLLNIKNEIAASILKLSLSKYKNIIYNVFNSLDIYKKEDLWDLIIDKKLIDIFFEISKSNLRK